MKVHPSVLALTLPTLLAGCLFGSDSPEETVEVQAVDPTDFSGYATIAETVGASGDFDASTQAFAAAGLAQVLSSDGPFTVFVVHDQTAGNLPFEAIAEAQTPLELDGVAQYHVLNGRHTIADLMEESSVETVGGQRLSFSHWNGQVEVGSFGGGNLGLGRAQVVEGDIQCSNGVVHVIDQVLFPSFDSLATQVEQTGSFTMLIEAARAAGVFEFLEQDGPYTVFAPTDEAFAKFAPDSVAYFMAEENRADLVQLLQHHVVPGRYYGDNMHHQDLTTLAGTQIDVDWESGAAYIGNSQVIVTDFEATNGVLHVVDSVLMPN